jgi:hypothetical protein
MSADFLHFKLSIAFSEPNGSFGNPQALPP